MKAKKYELSTNLIPIFSGTYGTMWEVQEYDDFGDEVEIEYDHADLMGSIAGLYQEEQEYITAEFKEVAPFIDKITIPGSFTSPREYNFATDVINLDVTININKLYKTLIELETDQAFSKFLKDHYSSYDGFMSFTPNNFQGIKSEILNEGSEDHQALAAVITYLLSEDDVNCFNEGNKLREIEYQMYESWSCNGYNGLDYKIIEPEEPIKEIKQIEGQKTLF